jgi:formyl-CoA transferase/CoA:oxalate CoA-transferase
MTGDSPAPVGNEHLSVVPYGVFAAADGHVVLAIVTEPFWPKLCLALDRMDLANDVRYCSNAQRVAHRQEVNDAIATTMRTRTVQQWCERLAAADVPHAPVLSVADALRHEQIVARGMVRTLTHAVLGPIESLGPVIQFADGTDRPDAGAPTLGADTEAVLRDILAYPAARIEDLLPHLVAGDASSASHETTH